MKLHNILLSLTLGFLTYNATADTIELKSGTIYKGKIISEDAKNYLVKINVTKSITDERSIPKDQVAKITKDSKDAKDYQVIRSMVPTPNLLTEKAYLKRIRFIEKFLKKYPKSSHIKEVQLTLSTIKKEYDVIVLGGKKIQDKLLSPEEVKQQAYEIDAFTELYQMKKLARAGKYHLALRHWEKLEKSFPHSSAYKENISLATRIIKTHQNQLNKYLNSLNKRIQARLVAQKSLNPSEQARMKQVIKNKERAYLALIEKEQKKLKTKWLSIDPFQKKGLEYNLRSTKTALQKIYRVNLDKVKLAGPEFVNAWEAIEKKDIKATEKAVQSLQSLQIDSNYLTPIKTKITEMKAAEKAAKEAEKAAKIEAEKKAAEEAAKKKKGAKHHRR